MNKVNALTPCTCVLQVRGRLHTDCSCVFRSCRPVRGGVVCAGHISWQHFERETSQHTAVPDTTGRGNPRAHLQPAQQTPADAAGGGLLCVTDHTRPGKTHTYLIYKDYISDPNTKKQKKRKYRHACVIQRSSLVI